MESIVNLLHKQTAPESGEHELALILPRALALARALGRDHYVAWLKNEMEGYAEGDRLPLYRDQIDATLIIWMPANGWATHPFSIQSERPFELHESLAQVQQIVRDNPRNTGITVRLSAQRQAELQAISRLRSELAISVPKRYYLRIPLLVRHGLHLWMADLRQKGVKGKGLIFSEQEKQRALQTTGKLGSYLDAAQSVVDEQVERSSTPGLLARLFRA